MSGPRAPHLEIRSAAPEGARFLAGLAQREGVELGVLDRGRHAVAYAKGAEAIGAVLAAAGASSVVLSLEEQAVLGATRARANRLANADHAISCGRAAQPTTSYAPSSSYSEAERSRNSTRRYRKSRSFELVIRRFR